MSTLTVEDCFAGWQGFIVNICLDGYDVCCPKPPDLPDGEAIVRSFGVYHTVKWTGASSVEFKEDGVYVDGVRRTPMPLDVEEKEFDVLQSGRVVCDRIVGNLVQMFDPKTMRSPQSLPFHLRIPYKPTGTAPSTFTDEKQRVMCKEHGCAKHALPILWLQSQCEGLHCMGKVYQTTGNAMKMGLRGKNVEQQWSAVKNAWNQTLRAYHSAYSTRPKPEPDEKQSTPPPPPPPPIAAPSSSSSSSSAAEEEVAAAKKKKKRILTLPDEEDDEQPQASASSASSSSSASEAKHSKRTFQSSIDEYLEAGGSQPSSSSSSSSSSAPSASSFIHFKSPAVPVSVEDAKWSPNDKQAQNMLDHPQARHFYVQPDKDEPTKVPADILSRCTGSAAPDETEKKKKPTGYFVYDGAEIVSMRSLKELKEVYKAKSEAKRIGEIKWLVPSDGFIPHTSQESSLLRRDARQFRLHPHTGVLEPLHLSTDALKKIRLAFNKNKEAALKKYGDPAMMESKVFVYSEDGKTTTFKSKEEAVEHYTALSRKRKYVDKSDYRRRMMESLDWRKMCMDLLTPVSFRESWETVEDDEIEAVSLEMECKKLAEEAKQVACKEEFLADGYAYLKTHAASLGDKEGLLLKKVAAAMKEREEKEGQQEAESNESASRQVKRVRIDLKQPEKEQEKEDESGDARDFFTPTAHQQKKMAEGKYMVYVVLTSPSFVVKETDSHLPMGHTWPKGVVPETMLIGCSGECITGSNIDQVMIAWFTQAKGNAKYRAEWEESPTRSKLLKAQHMQLSAARFTDVSTEPDVKEPLLASTDEKQPRPSGISRLSEMAVRTAYNLLGDTNEQRFALSWLRHQFMLMGRRAELNEPIFDRLYKNMTSSEKFTDVKFWDMVVSVFNSAVSAYQTAKPVLKGASEILRDVRDVSRMRERTRLAKQIITCPVCLEPNLTPMVLPCGHSLCYSCLEAIKSMMSGPQCPICRMVIPFPKTNEAKCFVCKSQMAKPYQDVTMHKLGNLLMGTHSTYEEVHVSKVAQKETKEHAAFCSKTLSELVKQWKAQRDQSVRFSARILAPLPVMHRTIEEWYKSNPPQEADHTIFVEGDILVVCAKPNAAATSSSASADADDSRDGVSVDDDDVTIL